jgi:hypothetical protein
VGNCINLDDNLKRGIRVAQRRVRRVFDLGTNLANTIVYRQSLGGSEAPLETVHFLIRVGEMCQERNILSLIENGLAKAPGSP